jgi:hypothetical protein
MATKKEMEFPRINFVAIIAGAFFLASLFLPWWGLDVTGVVGQTSSWSLWSGPSRIYPGSADSAQTLTTYSPYIGALVIAAAVLLLVGIVPKGSRLIIGGSILAVVAPIAYALIVNNAVSTACSGMSDCISGPFGAQTNTAGPFTITVNWGFQPGFYLEVVGAVLSIIAIAFHRTYLTRKNA